MLSLYVYIYIYIGYIGATHQEVLVLVGAVPCMLHILFYSVGYNTRLTHTQKRKCPCIRLSNDLIFLSS
jgi:hypothetical protein